MIGVLDAHRIIRETIQPAPVEEQPLASLYGKVLAMDITAGFPMPRFTNAAMDGFAVRVDDVRHASEAAPAVLAVTQDIPAGAATGKYVEPGTCAQIMTGAPLPEGADTVVAFEQTSGFGSPTVAVYHAPKRGVNVRYRGEEAGTGDLLIKKGTRVTPAEISVMAAFGYSAAEVYRTPRVGVLTVGDELRAPGEKMEDAAIYNSNLVMLDACCRAAGVDVSGKWQVSDDTSAIRTTLENALSVSDVLVTSGGISSGQYDFMQQLLAELGVEKKIWKVAQKPGKPFYFGKTVTGSAVFSLPGNPVSSLVCFLEYVMPALYFMQGLSQPAKVQAVLDEPFPADKKRYRFLFGSVRVENGSLKCSVSRKVESHMITTLMDSNCLLEAGPAELPLPGGTLITCTLLPWASLFG
jgi:molybdopterin molybdotransferase